MTLDDVLWSSRGLDWGFKLLHLPGARRANWLEVRDAVFGSSLNDESFYTRGETPLGGKVRERFVALRFLDPENRLDSSGRPIPHEVIIFGPSCNGIDSWETGRYHVWPLLRERYAELYRKPPSEFENLPLPKSGNEATSSSHHLHSGLGRGIRGRLLAFGLPLSIGLILGFLTGRSVLPKTDQQIPSIEEQVRDENVRHLIKELTARDGTFPTSAATFKTALDSLNNDEAAFDESQIAAAAIYKYLIRNNATGRLPDRHK